MRLNGGTIVLVVALVVIIGLVLLLNNNQAAAPGDSTPAATNAPVFLLPGVNQDTLARLEVRDNLTGQRTVLTKADVDSPWLFENANEGRAEALTGVQEGAGGESAGSVSGTGAAGEADPAQVATVVGLLTNLQSADSFESDQLGDFGLTNPAYTVAVTTYDGAVYFMHIGASSRVNPRYYVVVEQPGRVPVDADATAEPQAIGTAVTGADEQIGAGGESNSEGVALNELTQEATQIAPMTNETQAAVVGDNIQATNAAVATQTAQPVSPTDLAATVIAAGGSVATEEATQEATAESTGEFSVEPTAAPGAADIEPTTAPLAEPLVALQGSFRVFLVQQSTVNSLIALISAPPVLVLTPEATDAPFSTDGTDEPLVEPPQTSLTEVTPEATAEATAAP